MRDFFGAGLLVECAHIGRGTTVLLELFDFEMGVAKRGQLWQMGDAQHLMGMRQPPQFLPDGATDAPANTGIDFVEDERGWGMGAFAAKHSFK